MSSSKGFRKEDITGKTVIYSSGRTTGTVKDLTFTLDGMITLIVEKTDGGEVLIPLSKVMGVSDMVIVKEESATRFGGPAPGMIVCKSCGRESAIGTLWCPGCGKSLA
ncbi:MAG: PRC-barrel domain-containing protein [Nitrososphaerales archaeon]|jgi:sporulation protein YlmC with PRC-barrel domain